MRGNEYIFVGFSALDFPLINSVFAWISFGLLLVNCWLPSANPDMNGTKNWIWLQETIVQSLIALDQTMTDK